MKTISPFAATATVLLHAALIVVVAHGLSSKKQSTLPAPLPVQVVPAQLSPVATPSDTPIAEPQATAAPRQSPAVREKKRPDPKQKAETRPAPLRRKATSSPIPTPEAAPTATTSGPTAAAPVAPTPPAASTAPAFPAAPARTGVSIATYGAGNPKPPYPRLSRINNEEGTVLLRVLVKADGSAGAVEIKSSSGYPLLDQSAKTTVQKSWHFNPATINGRPVDDWYEIPIPFKLLED